MNKLGKLLTWPLCEHAKLPVSIPILIGTTQYVCTVTTDDK